MTGKRLFFLSLIVLSVAMGIHWAKIRPKTKPRRTQPRTALRLDDLQLQDQQNQENDQNEDSKRLLPDQDADFDSDADPDLDDPNGSVSDTSKDDADQQDLESDDKTKQQPDADSDIVASDTPGIDDPIIIAFHNLQRNPFQKSPYAILMDEIRAQRGMTQNDNTEIEEIPPRQVRLLNANFSATIQTERELVAVINSSLYRKGEIFQSREITEIRDEYVSLESPQELLLIPKHGVSINIDEHGNFTVDDTFRQ